MESSLLSTQNLDFGESAERKDEAKSYKEMISTFPRVLGWSCYEGFWYNSVFLEGLMSAQDHFIPQSTDIFITSCPKTGTTWLKSLTFSICTRSRLSGSSASSLLTKMPHDCVPLLEYDFAQNTIKRDCAVPLVSTHVPYSSLPKSIVSSCCKIIYICRDAKDAFVSLWHFIADLQRTKNIEPLSLEEALELFCSGISGYGPYWDHVLGYWRASLEFPEKILFLTYEEMKKDTASHVKKLAEFMGCSFTLEEEEEGEVQKIISLCSFEKLSNLAVNKNEKPINYESVPIDFRQFGLLNQKLWLKRNFFKIAKLTISGPKRWNLAENWWTSGAKRSVWVSFASFRLQRPGYRNSVAFEFQVISLEHVYFRNLFYITNTQ